MKSFFKIIILFLVLSAVVYHFRSLIPSEFLSTFEEIKDKAISIFFEPAPCTEPIVYDLGAFDQEFDISKEYFLNAISTAESIWEKPFGKELFTYKEGAKGSRILKINLIYDYRQQATSKLQNLGIEVSNSRASYDALKIKFGNLKGEIEKTKTNYESSVAAFNVRQKAYEEKVKYWNRRGGAPQKEYNELQSEGIALEKEMSRLETLLAQINKMIEEVNAMVAVLNRMATTLNISVEKYNTIGASRGESFEEGVYSTDGSGREIDIYEFSSKSKLVRVLAHELGHALGLDHVEDEKAIMYELNQGNSVALSPYDIAALEIKCDKEIN